MIQPEVLLAALAGLLLGSFLNVCIFRWPRDLSVVRPRSMCPECEQPIAWYDNIPVLSYLLLKGRCRNCQVSISWRYPLVESLTAVAFASAVWQHGLTLPALKLAVYSFLILGCIFADFADRILPDEFTLGGIVIALGFAVFVWLPQGLPSLFVPFGWPEPVRSVVEALFGGGFPSLSIYLVGELYYKLRKKEGLGLGDVKMIGMMGAFYGLPPTMLAILVGSFGGSLISLAFLYFAKKDSGSYELPFGSFLGIASLLVIHLERFTPQG
ncbi:MAG: prepilin peptidase [Bryobacteraceae bacterium]|nr:prepilin peptidase [Bryobacteraceae bacterium]